VSVASIPSRSAQVPDALTPPPGNPRFPLVDSLRAIAALAILLGHVIVIRDGGQAGVFGGLGAGVTVFFVITGFLLYRPFVSARTESRPEPTVPAYARRRLLRIVPAFWVALSVVTIYPGLVDPVNYRWAYYGLVQNYFPQARTGGLPQTWSLSVEFTFYVLLPVYAAVARSLAGRSRRVGGDVALLLALVGARLVYEVHPVQVLATPVADLDWFVVGMGLAVLSAALARLPGTPAPVRLVARHPGVVWIAAALVYCSFAFSDVNGRDRLVIHVLQAIFAGLLVLPAVFSGEADRPVHRFLGHRRLAWLGLVSYGIFLWHVPVVEALARSSFLTGGPLNGVLVLGVATVALTLPLAALSYYAVERPMLRFKDPGRARQR
jgi:peptidoglycan/LPS O-acetylase OafA/YrhL